MDTGSITIDTVLIPVRNSARPSWFVAQERQEKLALRRERDRLRDERRALKAILKALGQGKWERGQRAGVKHQLAILDERLDDVRLRLAQFSCPFEIVPEAPYAGYDAACGF